MLINQNNFDLNSRIGMDVIPDNTGWIVLENFAPSLAEYYGVANSCFLIFIEIFDLDGNLIINYPVQTAGEAELEDCMKKEILQYARLLENTSVRAAAIKMSLVTSPEWAAFESFNAAEEIIVETLRRVEKEARTTKKSVNETQSYLDLLAENISDDDGETPFAPVKAPLPSLNENLADHEITIYPLLLCSQSHAGKNFELKEKADSKISND